MLNSTQDYYENTIYWQISCEYWQVKSFKLLLCCLAQNFFIVQKPKTSFKVSVSG